MGADTHRVSREEGSAVDHLCKDAADGPDIHRRGVVLSAQQDLRCSVPERDNLYAGSTEPHERIADLVALCEQHRKVLPGDRGRG